MSVLGPYLITPPLNPPKPKASRPPPILKPGRGGPHVYDQMVDKTKVVNLARVFQMIAGWQL